MCVTVMVMCYRTNYLNLTLHTTNVTYQCVSVRTQMQGPFYHVFKWKNELLLLSMLFRIHIYNENGPIYAVY